MSTTTFTDLTVLRRWASYGMTVLEEHQQEINVLNVFPVPDKDTGTNLVHTFRAAYGVLLGEQSRDGAEVLQRAAQAALLATRGSSGVILAQWLMGLTTGRHTPSAKPPSLATALETAMKAAYRAVETPLEGTMLTVARAAAHASDPAQESELLDQAQVAAKAARAAAIALADTPHQLPALAQARVVDAGGRGLVLLLYALAAALADQPPAVPPLPQVGPRKSPPEGIKPDRPEEGFSWVPPSAGEWYEVQYVLTAEAAAVAQLRRRLATIGDSVMAGTLPDGRVHQIHVHTADVGAVIEAGIAAGKVSQIRVTNISIAQARWEKSTIVACVGGAGLAELFTTAGAISLSANSLLDELLDTIEETTTAHIVILPNSPHMAAVAEAAAAQADDHGRDVVVVPTQSPVQGIAALAVHDPARAFSDDVRAMAEAASATRWAEIVEIAPNNHELLARCTDLLDRLLGEGGELVTLVLGATVPSTLAAQLENHLQHDWPAVEYRVYDGGQPQYPLLVGVE